MELENKLLGLLILVIGIVAIYICLKNQSKDFDPALADEGLIVFGIVSIFMGLAALFGAIDFFNFMTK